MLQDFVASSTNECISTSTDALSHQSEQQNVSLSFSFPLCCHLTTW